MKKMLLVILTLSLLSCLVLSSLSVIATDVSDADGTVTDVGTDDLLVKLNAASSGDTLVIGADYSISGTETSYVIKSGVTLRIDPDAKLTIPSTHTLDVRGELDVAGKIELMCASEERMTVSGDITGSGVIKLYTSAADQKAIKITGGSISVASMMVIQNDGVTTDSATAIYVDGTATVSINMDSVDVPANSTAVYVDDDSANTTITGTFKNEGRIALGPSFTDLSRLVLVNAEKTCTGAEIEFNAGGLTTGSTQPFVFQTGNVLVLNGNANAVELAVGNELTIPVGSELRVPSDTTITIEGTLNVQGRYALSGNMSIGDDGVFSGPWDTRTVIVTLTCGSNYAPFSDVTVYIVDSDGVRQQLTEDTDGTYMGDLLLDTEEEYTVYIVSEEYFVDTDTNVEILFNKNYNTCTAAVHFAAITYDSNGSSDTGSTEDVVQYVVSGLDTELKYNLFTFDGYSFSSWKSEESGNVYKKEGDSGESIRTVTDVVLVAQWSGESWQLSVQGTSSAVTVQLGSRTTTVNTAPLKTGYHVSAYLVDGKQLIDSDGELLSNVGVYTDKIGNWKYSMVGVTNKPTLTIEWVADDYTLTIYDGSKVTNGTISVTYGSSLATVESPEKSGYTISGYYISNVKVLTSDGELIPSVAGFTDSDGKWLNASGNTLNASVVWTAKSYVVKFDANCTEKTGGMNDLVMNSGESKTLSVNQFEREGYTFGGWNVKADGTGKAYGNGEVVESVTEEGSITLYAQWVPNEYEVILVLGDDTGEVMNITYGNVSSISDIVEPTMDGYVFKGWNTKADGTGDMYSTNDLVYVTGDMELYPVFEYKTMDAGMALTFIGLMLAMVGGAVLFILRRP